MVIQPECAAVTEAIAGCMAIAGRIQSEIRVLVLTHSVTC